MLAHLLTKTLNSNDLVPGQDDHQVEEHLLTKDNQNYQLIIETTESVVYRSMGVDYTVLVKDFE